MCRDLWPLLALLTACGTCSIRFDRDLASAPDAPTGDASRATDAGVPTDLSVPAGDAAPATDAPSTTDNPTVTNPPDAGNRTVPTTAPRASACFA